MSETTSSATGSSFASSDGGSSIASDNTDSRALGVLNAGSGDGENADDLENNNKSIQETVFSTVYTLTKNRALDASLRLAVLKVVLEFLQLFRVLFNSSFAWKIQTELWIFKGIQWLLFRMLVLPKGYDSYIVVFYILASLILATLLCTAWVSFVLKGNETNNIWLKRLIAGLQLFGMVIYTIFWPAILDYMIYLFNCHWTNLAVGAEVVHIGFPEKGCLAMPHLAHMLLSGIVCITFGGMTLLMSIGMSDMNPMTRSLLASSDAVTSFKILALKMVLVVFSTALDDLGKVQVVVMLIAVASIVYYLVQELPFYSVYVNMIWCSLWYGLLLVVLMLTGLTFTMQQHLDDPQYAERLTGAILYGIFPAVLLGAATIWVRMSTVRRLSRTLHSAYEERKEAAIAASSNADAQARAAGASAVILMGDLKSVYRFKDVRQVSILCRDMRRWDEDGLPDPEATEYGEFVLKCGMARLPNNPVLLVRYANFLIEVRKDGQGARTQMQLAQKANPALLDNYNIYTAQQLAKQLKRDGDSLDLLSYVEYQRNYRACVRAHSLALMAQRQFWTALLRDAVAFKDLQKRFEMMEMSEERATATYRRVLERYPNNGKLLKVYGRFLEFVRNDPWTAAKFYDEALKQGTTESLLSMTAGQASAGMSAAGPIDEKVDGLVIINAQGIIMMVNAATLDIFGYDKGELEGKNVNILMPQPISSHHNGFLQRYVEGGQPHIVNKLRAMVALHKDRSMFPVELCATCLSGMGADTLFIGVLRRSTAAAVDGNRVIRFWTTSTGVILCADRSAADSFGVHASDLVGQSFSNLCTDVESVTRFITSATQMTAGLEAAGVEPPKLKAQILHTYLPAVDVELSMQFGGAVDKQSDCRSITVEARLVNEACPMMVLDHKGRLVYATDKLSSMLGYPVASLVKMELNTLLPPPYCQMHGTWFKDLSKKPAPTSCRAGGVVQLLAANGTKVLVTLKMSIREDAASGRLTHIVQVMRAGESERLDQQRLLLNINHKGTILEVNTGAPKSLYGFTPSELVGRPLAAIVDVFGLWRHKFGEDGSLLALLAAQAMSEAGGGAAGGKADSAGHMSWRVGVHIPVKKDEQIADHAVQLAADSKGGKAGAAAVSGAAGSLLHALQQRNRLRAASMSVGLLAQDEELLEDAAAAETTAVLQVSLYRADTLTAVLELDKHLAIMRTDDSAGRMFGLAGRQLMKKSFARLVGLPASTTFEELLGNKGAAAAKKGAMKAAGGAGTSRMGQTKKLTAHHLGDGKPLVLEMQAMSYDQGGKSRLLVRLQLLEPASASLPALLQLKEGKVEAAAAAKAALADADQHTEHTGDALSHGAGGSHSSHTDSDGEEGGPVKKVAHDKAPAKLESFARISDWVRETSELPKSQDTSPNRHHGGPAASDRHAATAGPEDEGEAAVYVSAKQRGRGMAGQPPHPAGGGRDKYGKPCGDEDGEEYTQPPGRGGKGKGYAGEDDYLPAAGSKKGYAISAPVSAGPGSQAESASVGGSASVGDGASEAGGGSVSSATGTGHDEDLAVDTRRAKRLKKLNRMVQSSVAQMAINRWRRHTLALLAVMLVAHVACFAVLTTQISGRYENAQQVMSAAQLLASSQQSVLRANFLQKCWETEFQAWDVCSEDSMKRYKSKLELNIGLTQKYHQQLYLGVSSSVVQPFKDKRLVNYWTHEPLAEEIFFPVITNGTEDVLVRSTRTLWEMGNVFVNAGREVLYFADTWKDSMINSTSWQYIFQNGPGSLFSGYAWSLDTFVDYTWQDLTTLSVTVVVLLIVEAVVVLMSCMAYEFYLVQQCNVSHMRLFSVFLALPSATVRLMAQRQLQVDDETREALDDDDDMDMAGLAAAGAAGGAGEASGAEGEAAADKKKSVRMHVDVADDDDDGESDADGGNTPSKAKCRTSVANKEGRSSGKLNQSKPGGAGSSSKAAAKKKPEVTGFAHFKKVAYKSLFGWLDPKFRRNGKKLVASTSVVWRFMVPLLLWLTAVVAIFAVSDAQLKGVQGPLASLDLSAHVMYRLTRARLYANLLAFSTTTAEDAQHRAELKKRLDMLRSEYTTLLYGGTMLLQANVTFDPVAPASAFDDAAIADIFFTTKSCLRHDKNTCYKPDSEWYTISHSGIDAMMNRYLDTMTTFSNLPNELAFANHSSYTFTAKVVGTDLYEALQTAGGLFVDYTISRFESVKQLHVILLALSLAFMVLFLLVLYRPYIKLLRRDTKAVAGMLSQLPAEVDVEGHVKTVVLGIVKPVGGVNCNQSMISLGGKMMGAGNGMMMGPGHGMMVPAGYRGQAAGMGMGGTGAPGAAAEGGRGWFGGKSSAGGPQMAGNMGYMQEQGGMGYMQPDDWE